MGKQGVYKYISFMLLLISTLMAVFTLFGLFGGTVDPASGTAMAMLVYVLPFLLGGNVLILIYWLIRRRWHWVAIPAIPLLCGIPYMGTVYQPGFFNQGETSRSGIKVATYNVAMFGRETSGFKSQDILAEMKRQNVDILCIQEYENVSGDKLNSDSYKGYFPYSVTGRSDMIIYSRYPIERHETIDFGPTNNSAMWADININSRIVRVFNAHLETTGFNRALHHAARDVMQGRSIENNMIIRMIYGNYTRGMAIRARQADMLHEYIERNSRYPLIVCGDMNDTPISYVRRTIAQGLTDCFQTTGKGFGLSYNQKGFYFRIDHILCSEQFKPYNCEIDNKMDASDHYPIICRLKLADKP